MSQSPAGSGPAAATTTSSTSLFHTVIRRAGGAVKTSFAAAGLIAAVGLAIEYEVFSNMKLALPGSEKKSSDAEKKVLVVPFHRLQLVEHKQSDWRSQLSNLDSGTNQEDKVIQMELRELVDLIHHAAADPDVSALYGIFGHGSELASQGWADLEEVRNALKVFRESHRRHPDPNLSHQVQVIPLSSSKPLYAYADSFASLADPANKEYYLASIFTHIHMQKQGELNLLGLISQQVFLRGLLEKYSIGVNVFKHGQYKNAPNMFTDYKMNRAHLQNVSNILHTLNQDVCDDITDSRSKALLASWLRKQSNSKVNSSKMWKQIHDAGTFSAVAAWKAGLVDFLPRRDPLPDLIDSKVSYEKREEKRLQWNLDETDFERFKASKAIGLKDYAKEVAKAKKAEERSLRIQRLVAPYPVVGRLLSAVGMGTHSSQDVSGGGGGGKNEKIALVYLEGTIGDAAARKTVNTIRKIRNDENVKAVVLRVSSRGGMITPCETISQELQALTIPVVVSFGNVSASGGYYVAAAADRIFCSKKTVTGSIGVFGIRLDLTQLAAKYGINVQHVSVGDLAAVYSPMQPMTRKMKNNVAASMDRYYATFKNVVASGRDLPLDYVETIAQGRVWTGDQAKTNGLVDELGGLFRAIAYARHNYTAGDAEVVVWPKRTTFFEKLMEAREHGDARLLRSALYEYMGGTSATGEQIESSSRAGADTANAVAGLVDLIMNTSPSSGLPGTLAGVMLAADEDTAIRCLLDNAGKGGGAPSFPVGFWE
jgi:protease-4